MSKYTNFGPIQGNSRYSELYHDALVALWREQYERSLRSGAPAPDLPHEVEQAVIRRAHRAQSQVMADVLTWPFRPLARLLRTAWRRAR